MIEVLEPKKKDQIENVRQKEVKKQLQFLGTLQPKKGQSMWQLDLNDGSVALATYDQANVDFKGSIRKKLVIKEGFLYCIAINKRNAERKFIKMIQDAAK